MSQLATQDQPVTVEEAKEKAKEKGQELRTQASERAREEVQSRASSAGEQLQSLSQTLRRTASELRTQGQEGQATVIDQIAIRAEKVAGYLSQSEPDQLVEDARQYGRRGFELAKGQPWLIAPLGIGVGLLAARMLAGRGDSQGSEG